MKRIVPTLERGDTGPAVVNLQDGLRRLITSRRLELGDGEREEWLLALAKESERRAYEDATAYLLERFQEQRGLEPSGRVDQDTAEQLNNELEDLGGFAAEDDDGDGGWERVLAALNQQADTLRAIDQETSAIARIDAAVAGLDATVRELGKPSRMVSGQVRRSDGQPAQGYTVYAAHETQRAELRLGQDVTDREGRYTIRYDQLPGVDAISLRVSLRGDDGRTLAASPLIANAPAASTLDLVAPLPGAEVSKRSIVGRVMLQDGRVGAGVRLRLIRREFGGNATTLDETTAQVGGRYALSFTLDPAAASLQILAIRPPATEVPLDAQLAYLGSDATITRNLLAPADLIPRPVEFQRMQADLQPIIGDISALAGAQETATRQDLTALNRATRWDARLLAQGGLAARLSADGQTPTSVEAFYGLLRAGLPSDKTLLAQVDAAVVASALTTVRDAGIIGLDNGQIETFAKDFQTFSADVRLSLNVPGGNTSYARLLEASGVSPAARASFASVYASHGGDAAQLWKEASDAGVSEPEIARLQLQGKLAFLTGSSQEMTTHLLQMPIDNGAGAQAPLTNPAQLADLGLYTTEAWDAQLTEAAAASGQSVEALIPSAFPGEPAQRRKEFSAEMARKVRVSYPMQVLAHQIRNDAADDFQLGAASGPLASVLRSAGGQGFRLGATPVDAFFASHPGVFEGMSAAEQKIAQASAKDLQRTYQISPDDATMKAMRSKGLHSAQDVISLGKQHFIEFYGPIFPDKKVAELVYRKAEQVSSMVYNLFTLANQIESQVLLYGASAPTDQRTAVKNELIKHYPTLDSLFGSMDFCECEHCRSVLSPAAYLVDLLQYLEAEDAARAGFADDWKDRYGAEYSARYALPYDALIERRPDLPHIPLTCENTNTALPYIDIVNEILEYYVANGALAAATAHDTGEATTAELLAEPQNVIRDAYEIVRGAYYPLSLPFDLWLETVRQFCSYFETPLAALLEAFRPGDELLVPAQPYDRAAIFIESLGLAPDEAALFTDAKPLAGGKWQRLYGYQPPVADAAALLSSAKTLAHRLGVSYKEVVEIIKTGFVNPRLVELTLLYKLGATVQDVLFYRDHRLFHAANNDLLGKQRAELSPADQTRYDNLGEQDPATALTGWDKVKRVQALLDRLAAASLEFAPFDVLGWVDDALAANAFNDILVLADPAAGCDFDATRLRYADGRDAAEIDFLRINLFVRLWRKLGWTIEETDRALTIFTANTPFTAANLHLQPLRTALIYLAHLKRLDEALKVGKNSRLKLLTLWADLATTGKKPLYAQLFLTRSALKSGTFEIMLANGDVREVSIFDRAAGAYLDPANLQALAELVNHRVSVGGVKDGEQIDPAAFAAVPAVSVEYDPLGKVQVLAYRGLLTDAMKAQLAPLSNAPSLPKLLEAVQAKAQEFTLLKGHLPALQGALSLTGGEIDAILKDAGLDPATAALSLPHVSLLYRYGLLAKALGLSVPELITLKALSGLDPFKALHPTPPELLVEDHPYSQTIGFVEIAAAVAASGFSIEDLDYVLRHQLDPQGKYRSNAEENLLLLKTLAEGIRAIWAEHALPADMGAISDEWLQQKLGLLLPVDVVQPFLAMINGAVGAATTLEQARDFFASQLKKQPLRQPDEAGYLEDGDFAALFTPLTPLKALKQIDSSDTPAEVEAKQAANLLIAAENQAIAAQNGQERAKRRARIATIFLPALQARLTRQLVVQTVSASFGGDPLLVRSLLTDERLLGRPPHAPTQPLLAALTTVAATGIDAAFYDAADLTGEPQPVRSLLASADIALKDPMDKDGNELDPANSARFSGYLEVPSAGAYRFYVFLEQPASAFELRFEHLPAPLFLFGTAAQAGATFGTEAGEFLELKPGLPYRFSLTVTNLNGGAARLLVQGGNLAMGPLGQLTLYAGEAMGQAEQALLLLGKVLQTLQTLGLSEREARYLLTHAADFGDVSLHTLPTLPTDLQLDKAAAAERFSGFRRLITYASLKRELAGGTDDLITIFEANGTMGANRLDELVYPRIAELTRRDDLVVTSVANALFAAPDFASEQPLQRLWEALQVVERFRVSVASLLSWTDIVNPRATPPTRFAIARDVRESIKARLDEAAWQRVAKPIFDRLRQQQRDALVAHVLHTRGFERLEQLYEYFLIDPGMEPVVQTSRIRLAIGSVQLFIQRCLLNLEPKVHPSAILNPEHWEWMKRYRVWEANRKIFLFPENWLEPEFRDDKSHLFTELEGTLLQGDVSRDLVEDAFFTYLRKLDELARLDICAMHLEQKNDPGQNLLHIFGRSFAEPHAYFYRRYAARMWTPWEPVTTEIAGDHLAPVIWRDRLYLFWVTFMEKPVPPNANVLIDYKTPQTVPSAPSTYLEAQLHWSEYLNGTWSTHASGGVGAPSVIRIDGASTASLQEILIHVSKKMDEEQELGVYIHLNVAGKAGTKQAFYLAGRNSAPVVVDAGALPANPYPSATQRRANRYGGSGSLKVTVTQRTTTEPGQKAVKGDLPILGASGDYTLLPLNHPMGLGVPKEAYEGAAKPGEVKQALEQSLAETEALIKPLFFQDNTHTFFVEPDVVERTIEEWQTWVEPAQPSGPVIKVPPPWFKEIVTVVIPELKPEPWPPEDLPFQRFEDLVVNPMTLVLFDGQAIGPRGKLPVTFAQGAPDVKAGSSQVLVNPAGAVNPGEMVVLGDELGLAEVGLKQAPGGFNLIGVGGFNAGMLENFNQFGKR